jgi:hypothetical protein
MEESYRRGTLFEVSEGANLRIIFAAASIQFFRPRGWHQPCSLHSVIYDGGVP